MEKLSLRVRCCIKSEDKYLLIEQSVSNQELLLFPGGGVDVGESLLAALLREIYEEVGLVLNKDLDYKIKAIREILIPDIYKCIEFFFFVDLGYYLETEQLKLAVNEGIKNVSMYSLSDLEVKNPKPVFWREIIQGNSTLSFTDVYTLKEYVAVYGDLPDLGESLELVHVMLKPDTLFSGNEKNVISDLLTVGGVKVYEERLNLNSAQVKSIYSDFSFESARKLVFDYLTDNETVQLAFVGSPGLHFKYNKLKGKTGGLSGLRAKYIKEYIRLDSEAFKLWLASSHPNQNAINLEMFCCNVLHVAQNQKASLMGLRSLLV